MHVPYPTGDEGSLQTTGCQRHASRSTVSTTALRSGQSQLGAMRVAPEPVTPHAPGLHSVSL